MVFLYIFNKINIYFNYIYILLYILYIKSYLILNKIVFRQRWRLRSKLNSIHLLPISLIEPNRSHFLLYLHILLLILKHLLVINRRHLIPHPLLLLYRILYWSSLKISIVYIKAIKTVFAPHIWMIIPAWFCFLLFLKIVPVNILAIRVAILLILGVLWLIVRVIL